MFRLLFERSADPMSLFDPEIQRFVESNEAVVRQTRAPDKMALGTASPAEISPERQPDGRLSGDKAREVVNLALANGSHRFEWLSRRYDGSELPLDIVMTAIPVGGRTLLFTVSRDISAQKDAEREILRLNAELEKRVAERTAELLRANEQLRRAQEELRHRSEQLEKHRDVLMELAQMDKSDLQNALQRICSLAASTSNVARVSYWSLEPGNNAIVCQILYLQKTGAADGSFRGVRLPSTACPHYFKALAAKRPIVAHDVLHHPATSELTENYLKPLGISSMLDAPVWVRGKVVGVLCHEHTGPMRQWTDEEVDFVSGLATMVSLTVEASQRVSSEQQLRESEQKFRALFEGSNQPVVLHDENGIFDANPSWLKYLGYSNIDEVRGKQPNELSAPIQPSGEPSDELAQKYIASAFATGGARFDWMVRRRDGVELPIEVFLTPIQINGKPVMQAICYDISERKKTEAKLIAAVEREKELGQLRSNFVSMVSHEFRTPLGIIQSSAEILENYLDRLGKDERRDHLRSIQRNTRRMAGMMEEVLLLGSFDAGKMEFRPAAMDLHKFMCRLVDEICAVTAHRCPLKLICGELPAAAQADERLLRHVFTNLLSNAAKYSEAGQPVSVEINHAGADAVFVIRDRGIGIPAEDQEWIFSPFHRGRNIGSRAGTGLGLVIVKRCVELHGGQITLESLQAKGTSVMVRLPLFRTQSSIPVSL